MIASIAVCNQLVSGVGSKVSRPICRKEVRSWGILAGPWLGKVRQLSREEAGSLRDGEAGMRELTVVGNWPKVFEVKTSKASRL